MLKFSRAISHVNNDFETDVSETGSASIIRVDDVGGASLWNTGFNLTLTQLFNRQDFTDFTELQLYMNLNWGKVT
jgi:hypothetical protein